jgi:hypothetical protein
MAAGVASGLQNRLAALIGRLVGSIPTRSRQLLVPARGRRPAMFFLCGAALAASPAVAIAQEPFPADTAATPRPVVKAAPVAGGAPTASQPQEAAPDTLFRPPTSPMGAFFRSLVLPGWGQAAVDQPLRGAFYFTMEAGSLFMLFKSKSKLDAAERAFPADSVLLESRQQQVEDWAVLAAFWALFAGIDAWVSAQLWDFQGEVVPPPDGSTGVAFRYSVPVGP